MKRLPRDLRNQIVTAIFALTDDPRPYGYVKVKSEKGVFRIRVGEYRIGYTIDDTAQAVAVIHVAPRSESYD